MKLHANAKLTPQGRALLVRRIRQQGWTVADAAQAAGVSVRTGYRWLARYRTEGPQGLLDRSVLIRDCSSWPRLDDCLRVTIGTPDENDAFLTALQEVLA